jgi:hypothetical protein
LVLFFFGDGARIVIPGRERRSAIVNPESPSVLHAEIPGSPAAVAVFAPE